MTTTLRAAGDPSMRVMHGALIANQGVVASAVRAQPDEVRPVYRRYTLVDKFWRDTPPVWSGDHGKLALDGWRTIQHEPHARPLTLIADHGTYTSFDDALQAAARVSSKFNPFPGPHLRTFTLGAVLDEAPHQFRVAAARVDVTPKVPRPHAIEDLALESGIEDLFRSIAHRREPVVPWYSISDGISSLRALVGGGTAATAVLEFATKLR